MFNLKKVFGQFLVLSISLTALAHAQLYRPLDDLDVKYASDVRGKTGKEVQAMSLKQYQDFINLDVNSPSLNVHYNRDDKKAQLMNAATANKVLEAAMYNPIISLHQYKKYDPTDRGIGFCFGRAMFIDLYLAINNFNRGSIKKAFVVGPMKTGDGGSWAWHVTTIVQSKNRSGKEEWIAIDPIMGRIMNVTEWYKESLKLSTDGKLRLYITESGKFSQRAYRYDYSSFNHPAYNKYFTDMLSWFEANDVSDDLGL